MSGRKSHLPRTIREADSVSHEQTGALLIDEEGRACPRVTLFRNVAVMTTKSTIPLGVSISSASPSAWIQAHADDECTLVAE